VKRSTIRAVQTGNDVHQREQGSVCVGEREHESPRFVSNIDIPPDLETVQRFENCPVTGKREATTNRIANCGQPVAHPAAHVLKDDSFCEKNGFSSRALRNRWKTSCRMRPSESTAVSGR